jgi:maltooligosyltrehalose synthase
VSRYLERFERRDFVMRFQQLTGPAMAKGLEDTAFYRHDALASLNEDVRCRDVLTGRELRALPQGAGGGLQLPLADLFAHLPVALLEPLP